MSFSYTQIDKPSGSGPFTFLVPYNAPEDVVVMGFNGREWGILPVASVADQTVFLSKNADGLIAIRISNNAKKVGSAITNGSDGNILDETSYLHDGLRIKVADTSDKTGSYPLTPEAITIAGIRKAVLSPDVAVGQKSDTYSNLTDGTEVGQLAYCNQSEGTQWLPNTVGGTYYPAGWYLWNGTSWVSDRNNIVNQLQMNITSLGNKTELGHTHAKSDITDFDENDYAVFEQGVLADTSLQPNDNVSELTNDANYVTETEAFTGDFGDYFNELTYTDGVVTKIETYDSPAKTTKKFTKTLSYTNGYLTQISNLNEATSASITKTLTYNASNILVSITTN